MAVTYANREIIFRGSVTMLYVEITLDNSYLSGGEQVKAADFGMATILGINPFSAKGFVVEPVRTDAANWLIKAYAYSASTNTATEFSSAIDRSAIVIPCIVLGR